MGEGWGGRRVGLMVVLAAAGSTDCGCAEAVATSCYFVAGSADGVQ